MMHRLVNRSNAIGCDSSRHGFNALAVAGQEQARHIGAKRQRAIGVAKAPLKLREVAPKAVRNQTSRRVSQHAPLSHKDRFYDTVVLEEARSTHCVRAHEHAM